MPADRIGFPTGRAVPMPEPALVWMGLALAAETALAVAALAAFGADRRGTDIALQLTARLSFLLFLPAYAGAAVLRLSGPRWQAMLPRLRLFGLAFAAAHIAHLGLVGWLCRIGAAPDGAVFALFGLAAFWTYLLALLSFGRLQLALGRRAWRLVRFIGMNYIMYAFAVDFLGQAPAAGAKYMLGYVPFAALSLAAPAVCLISFLRHAPSRPTMAGRPS